MFSFFYFLVNFVVADEGEGVYRVISWKGDPNIKVSLDKGVARIQNKETPQSKDDTAAAYFIPNSITTFRIKYKNGYLCKNAKNPGLKICDNKDDPYTVWDVVRVGDAYQIKTSNLCLKKMSEDKKSGAGGFYMNAASCGSGNIFKWIIDDLKIADESSDASDDTLEVKGNRMKVKRDVEEVSEPSTLMVGDLDHIETYKAYEEPVAHYHRETVPYYSKEVRPHYHRGFVSGG